MKAVFRHELSSYFTGMTGYVFGAFLLLFAGIYTMAVNLNAGLSNFEYVLSNLSFIFLIIVPILTMRVIAEERRQRTDQLLYSLPLSMTGVALGKYAALLVVFLVPTGIICLYPLVLSAFGSVYLPLAFGTAVGFFFLGAALLAIGMFLSSITESQGVAAGLCFVVMLVNYFISGKGFVRRARIYSRSGRHRYAAHARSRTHLGTGKENAHLSGFHLRTFRQGAGSSAEGNYSVLSPFSLRSSQAIWFLDHEKLSRKLRYVCR